MNKKDNKLIIYQTKTGELEFRGDFIKETIWANLDQIASVFGRDKSVISRHIKNIFKDGELNRDSVVAFFATTASDGKIYNVEYFNLDMIISVGYRANSKQATKFRQWATKILKKHIIDGYTIHKKLVVKNYQQFLKSVEDVKNILPPEALMNTSDVLELVSLFADTWLSLDAYDRNIFIGKKTTKKKISLTSKKLSDNLMELKNILIKKGEATDIFGLEREKGSISGIVGNVMQSFGGKDLYGSVEEKASYLLYFMVKNHPFVDGNKRSGAYAFIWFLNQAKILDKSKMTSPALTALTILVAESNPKEKNKVIQLILSLLR